MKLRALLLLAPLSLVASLVASLAAPSVARADSALDEARALTGKATVEYNVGRFQQALELYTKAYERAQKPALLFNIGQCHRLLGHYEEALFFYHGYLREQPEAPNRALAEQHIDESQRALDAQRAAEQASQKQQAQAAAQGTATPVASAAPSRPAVSTTTATASTEPSPHSNPSPVLRIAGLATAGVGVALLGTGIALGVHASSLSNEISQVSTQHGTWTSQYQSDYDSGKSSATAATILYIAGGTLLAGGVVMTWFGWPKSHATTASVAPLPGGAAVGLSGAF